MKKRRRSNASTFISAGRLSLFAAAIICVFCAILGRLYYLHVVRSDVSIAETDKARNRFDTIPARRGNITDVHRNLLATSRPVTVLGADPSTLKFTPENEKKLSLIAALIDLPYSELRKKCLENPDRQWVKLAEIYDDATYSKIMSYKVKGIYGNRKYERVYPSGELMSHVVGFVNKEFDAVMGIERQFDFYLRGQDGFIKTERDGRRRELVQFRSKDVPPTDGMNVELSIDLVLQEIVQSELRKINDKYNPDFATIIVSEPSTGYILAMASTPGFDPNNFSKYPQGNLRNRAISDQYEPGSTFKIVPISAALNESLVGPEDRFDCDLDTVTYKGRTLRLPREAHKMETLSVREIAKKSSMKRSVQRGLIFGERSFNDYAELFGFGQKTKIGLEGEIGGTLHEVKNWDGLTITRLPMGHAVAATPLQVHCAMSVIANQGIYMQPQLVRKIYDNSGQTIMNYPPRGVRKVINPKIANLMSEMLTEVVSQTGTASRAQLKGFAVAGKTGTSQKIVDGKYSNRKHVASFTGFFPAQRPRLVITVVVDSPNLNGIGYGGIVAAPSFKSVAEQAANYLGIQSDEEFEKKVAWKGFSQW